MRPKVILSAAAIMAAGLTAVPVSGARAAAVTSSASLPLPGYYQMAVDSVHDHLFFSQGSKTASSILVTGFSGAPVATITGQSGVMGITMSPDGSTLYAALSSDPPEVTAISTATLQQTATYLLPGTDIPQNVAVQSGKLWVSYSVVNRGTSQIGDFDLSASAAYPPFETQPAMGGWYSVPELAADPGNSGVLVAADGLDGTPVTTFDTAADPVTPLAAEKTIVSCTDGSQIAVLPGGTRFAIACDNNWPYLYDTADLAAPAGVLPLGTGTGAVALAVSPAGDLAAGTTPAWGGPVPGITVFGPAGTVLSVIKLDSTLALAESGLAWSADGSELFAVTQDSSTGSYVLDVIPSPAADVTLNKSALALQSAAAVPAGASVTVSGKLTLGAGTTPGGTAITITRTAAGAAAETFTVHTAAGGSFALTDKAPANATYTYTATYAGSATTTPASAAVKVTVARLRPSLTITAGAASYVYGTRAAVTATLGATFADRAVSIYATPAGQAKKLAAAARVNSAGHLSVSYPLTRTTTFTAVFAGDTHNSPATAARTVGSAARVTEALAGGYYKTTKINGTAYYVFRKSPNRIHLLATVSPNKRGECLRLESQQYNPALGWALDDIYRCSKLNAASQDKAVSGLADSPAGTRLRIRSDYVRSSKDTANLNADSGWLYLEVTK